MSRTHTPVKIFPSQTRQELRANPRPSQVARKLGVDVATVYRHAKGMDLKLIRRAKKLSLDTAGIVELLAEDSEMKQTEIATKLGISPARVSEVLHATK